MSNLYKGKKMKNLFLNTIVCGLSIFISSQASAGLLIEPHLGYNLHSSTKLGTETIDSNGFQYGSKLGYQSFGFMGGLDYTHSSFTATTKPNSGTSDKDERKRDEFGLFVGFKFPVLVKAWFGYNFIAKESQSVLGPTSGTKAGEYYKGHSTEIGIGFTPLPLVSINLSYKMLSYDKQNNTVATTALNPKFEPKEIILGISFPINLP
jgi:hypothetical protein